MLLMKSVEFCSPLIGLLVLLSLLLDNSFCVFFFCGDVCPISSMSKLILSFILLLKAKGRMVENLLN